ncbi:MAG: flavodoxin domain-containing protein [Candidatus Izemoplasmatales bacterium]|jgi:menaquinone-dependent protoporphyrinogen oxidase|nr:flavodoxin domain-containing protein [Candidatus Izemoplasmatales bacterium]MDD4988279.1 flavodoxin domain-containing protein [Candidatus Izemoplasmatales bacterium]MDD5602158.1 flavodoxin domain-containing protein [Candidatus Izemoplasmatales bacterium]MDY0373117.1 flavodoxin domain-containing protein [Candidatus Izemoplasmatales bacterium]NLF48992.1 hypothetical protein [Acholeplasmataceae bacterium]
MKNILIAYGSKYGATEEIARHIGQLMNKAGLHTDVLKADKKLDPSPYSAVIIGSAVYIGLWRENVTSFVKRQVSVLGNKPVWVFVSGPLGEGDPNELVEGWFFPKRVKPFIDQIQPRSIVAFGGKVDTEQLSGLERWMMKKINSPTGDYRNWEGINQWTQTIIEELMKE